MWLAVTASHFLRARNMPGALSHSQHPWLFSRSSWLSPLSADSSGQWMSGSISLIGRCALCRPPSKPGSLEWQFGNEECAKFVKCTLIFCTFSCNGRVTSIRIFLSWEEINNIWWGREAAPVRIRPRNTFTPDTNDQMTRPRSPRPAPHSDTPRHHQCLPAFISDNNWLSQSSLTVVGGEELSTEYTTQTSRLSDSH